MKQVSTGYQDNEVPIKQGQEGIMWSVGDMHWLVDGW